MAITFTTNDPKIQERTEQLFVLLRDEKAPEAEMRLLIEAGVDVGARDFYDNTVLHWTAWNGRTETIRLLLERGADIGAQNRVGDTALDDAAKNGHTETTRLLLDRGADVGTQNKDGESALHWAAKYGKIETAQLLLERGGNIWAEDKYGDRALHLAKNININSAELERILEEHIAEWQPRYEEFCAGQFHPQTSADWLGLASVMKLSDPQAYSSVQDRVAQLQLWRENLKALRSKAASPTIGELGV